jgi:rSAM/selenodomain-associated transferase 1
VGPVLIVIAKAPLPGRVKTRLCPPCTPAEAARLASAALEDTLAAALRASRPERLVLALEGEAGDWLPAGFEVVRQRGAGLAERLSAAFEDVGAPAFLVGMDTPQLTPALLDAGLAAVQNGGSAFGASPDGGYWGIGLREPDPAVFAGVPMSSPHTGMVQRARMTLRGLHPQILPPLLDVDTFQDALAVTAAAPRTRFADAVAALMLEQVAA